MACGDKDVILDPAPGSRIFSDCGKSQSFSVSSTNYSGVCALEIKGISGQVEIPLRLEGGRYVPLLVAADCEPTGDLCIMQRRGMQESYPSFW